jgi:hypothetical protein
MAGFKAYYSLGIGAAHIVVLATEMDFTNRLGSKFVN